MQVANEKTSGWYREHGRGNQKLIVEWHKLPALSDAFAEKMACLADLGIETFKHIEIDFLREYPQAVEEDKNLAAFSGLQTHELEAAISARLEKIFHMHPKEFSAELRTVMADISYYVVTIRNEESRKVHGFITFMSGGSIPKNEFKITILAVDKSARRSGLASFLIDSLTKIGIRYKKIFASTRPSNAVAINTYKNWGFSEDLEAMKSAPFHFINGHWVHLARYG